MSKRVQNRAVARPSFFASRLGRWTTFTPIVIGFGFAAATAAGHIAGGSVKPAGAAQEKIWRASLTPALDGTGATTVRVQTSQYLFDRTTTFKTDPTALNPAPASDDRFEAVVKQAALSSDKLRKAFKQDKPAPAAKQVAMIAPSAERFGAAVHKQNTDTSVFALAYASRDESPAAQALHNLADEEQLSREEASIPADELAIPDDVPLPSNRPRLERTTDEKPEADDIKVVKPDLRDGRKPSAREEFAEKPEPRGRQQKLAARSPERGAEKGGLGFSFRNIFGGGARAGKGVAVYDISAAKVYMPDGSVLSAASGIGKMANNPKYAHVKMNGPTPPHTYNLRMREKRFHGVEAIRMLPVDGRNKYGRDGFLAHTQLLRGRPGQSHGCVAFADYNKFLKAFKQGKVSQMVVVASGGRAAATRMASN